MIFLGFDTSNYKTSVAAVDEHGSILANVQKLLDVKEGERGLRQSEALFQHVNQLPVLSEQVFDILGARRSEICCVSASVRPRPVEGSYMPVFNAGYGAASVIAGALDVPLYTWSHQEGHIEAVRFGSPLAGSRRFVSFHLSGGTTEAVLVSEEQEETTYEIIGGSRDISYGQLLDRVGVAMGMAFPSGQEMDEIALHTQASSVQIPRIKVKEGYFNLSGLESHCQRVLAEGQTDRDALIAALFREIAGSMLRMTEQLKKKYRVEAFLFAGGVSSSRYIREQIGAGEDIFFGEPALSTDNAVGIALLGGRRYGIETGHGITTE